MKKYTFLLILAGIVGGQLAAQPRSKQELRELAHTYFQDQPTRRGILNLSSDAENQTALTDSSSHILADIKSGIQKESFYIYTQPGEGSVIVSADQRMPEILGYSDQIISPTEPLPHGLRTLLTSYQEATEYLDEGSAFETGSFSQSASELPEKVAPLLDTILWGQDYPFNEKCPQRNGSTTVVGCVSTALSAIMAYYQYPSQAKGSSRYSWNGTILQSDYSSHAYNWDKIRGSYMYVRYVDNSITRFFTSEEAETAAYLSYDAALALQSSFGVNQTSTQALPSVFIKALVTNFSYDPNIQGFYQRFFSRTDWLNLLKEEIAAGRPVVYTGFSDSEGHTFVADGYDSDNRIHFDFGWSGTSNGYYHVMDIQPGQAGTGASAGSNFSYNVFILTGVQPQTSSSNYRSHLTIPKHLSISSEKFDQSENFTITASFTNQGTSFNGDCAAFLYDEEGNSYQIAEKQSISLITSKVVNTQWECRIPDTLPSGMYKIYMMARDAQEKEWSFIRFITSISGHYEVSIDDHQVALISSASEVTLSEGNVTPLHTLYSGMQGDFAMTVANEENNYLGYVGVKMINNSYSKLVARDMASQEAGETCSYKLSGTVDIPAGTYQLVPVYYHSRTQTWIELATSENWTTVKETPSGPENVTYLQSQLPESTYKVGQKGLLQGSITLSNPEGTPYDQGLTWGIFLDGYPNTYSILMYSTPFFIDTDSTVTWNFSFPHNLPEGNYTAYLYKYVDENPVRIAPSAQTRFYFSVVNDSLLSRIETPEENKTLTAYFREGEIILQSPLAICQVAIFNTTSQCVLQSEADNNTLSLPVHYIESGVYIIRALQSDGRWVGCKIAIP